MSLRNKHRQDLLFRKIFLGAGDNGAWTANDWKTYINNRDSYWGNPDEWINPDQEDGWDLFALHVKRLASNYSSEEKDQFVRDFALVFGGVPSDQNFILASMEVAGGPVLPALNYTPEGLDSDYLDTEDELLNQSHHYAGIFFFSYFATPIVAHGVNFGREIDNGNVGDINLGNKALLDAWTFRQSTNTDLSILADMISALKQP